MKKKTIAIYLDDEGNEVPAEKASRLNIAEYDEQGNRVFETYMTSRKPMTEEEAEAYWDSILPELEEEEAPKKKEYSIEEMYQLLLGSSPENKSRAPDRPLHPV